MKVNYRQEYKLLMQQLKAANKDNARVMLSDLVLSLPVNGNNNSYTFPVLENDLPSVEKIPEEIRLNQNDLFSALEIGVFYRANLVNNTNPNTQVSIWLTSSPTELNSDFAVYERLYSGRMSWKVNNIVWMENWFLRKHLYKGVTQWQNSSAGLPYATFPANNFEDNSLQPCIPKINISGAKKNAPTIVLPEALNPLPTPIELIMPQGTQAGDPASNASLAITHIVLHCKGFLAQNCADFQTSESTTSKKAQPRTRKMMRRK